MTEPTRLLAMPESELERALLDAGRSYTASASMRTKTLLALGLTGVASSSAPSTAAAGSSLTKATFFKVAIAVLVIGAAAVPAWRYLRHASSARVALPPVVSAAQGLQAPPATVEPASQAANRPLGERAADGRRGCRAAALGCRGSRAAARIERADRARRAQAHSPAAHRRARGARCRTHFIESRRSQRGVARARWLRAQLSARQAEDGSRGLAHRGARQERANRGRAQASGGVLAAPSEQRAQLASTRLRRSMRPRRTLGCVLLSAVLTSALSGCSGTLDSLGKDSAEPAGERRPVTGPTAYPNTFRGLLKKSDSENLGQDRRCLRPAVFARRSRHAAHLLSEGRRSGRNFGRAARQRA